MIIQGQWTEQVKEIQARQSGSQSLVIGAVIEAFSIIIIFYAFNSAGKGRGNNGKKSDWQWLQSERSVGMLPCHSWLHHEPGAHGARCDQSEAFRGDCQPIRGEEGMRSGGERIVTSHGGHYQWHQPAQASGGRGNNQSGINSDQSQRN